MLVTMRFVEDTVRFVFCPQKVRKKSR